MDDGRWWWWWCGVVVEKTDTTMALALMQQVQNEQPFSCKPNVEVSRSMFRLRWLSGRVAEDPCCRRCGAAHCPASTIVGAHLGSGEGKGHLGAPDSHTSTSFVCGASKLKSERHKPEGRIVYQDLGVLD